MMNHLVKRTLPCLLTRRSQFIFKALVSIHTTVPCVADQCYIPPLRQLAAMNEKQMAFVLGRHFWPVNVSHGIKLSLHGRHALSAMETELNHFLFLFWYTVNIAKTVLIVLNKWADICGTHAAKAV